MSDTPTRVVRLLEYTYPSAEDAIRDQTMWAVPANGARSYQTECVIRSATLPVDISSNGASQPRALADMVTQPAPGSVVVVDPQGDDPRAYIRIGDIWLAVDYTATAVMHEAWSRLRQGNGVLVFTP